MNTSFSIRLAVLFTGCLIATSVYALPVRAATIAELEALIAQLQTELAALKSGTTGIFTVNLTLGSSGTEVTKLQNFLISYGHSIPAGATGYFGVQTQSALAAYQAANGISPASGYFGSITRAKVNAQLQVVVDEEDEDEEEMVDEDEEIPEEEDEDIDPVQDVTTSAKTVTVSGSNNDYAEFEITLDIKAFGEDAFIPRDGSDAFTYQIEDAGGGVGAAGTATAVVSSNADEEGGAYRIDEGASEEFTFTVTFDPTGSGAANFRLQLLSVIAGDVPGGTSLTWNVAPQSKYQTNYAYINN